MKKLFLLILFFTSISFAQLVKPSNAKTAIVSDSLSLKYFTSDSSNIYGGYKSFKSDTSVGFNNISLGMFSLDNYSASNLRNIVLGDSSGGGNSIMAYPHINDILIGSKSGYSTFNWGRGSVTNNNIGIGEGSLYDQGSGTLSLYNNNIGIGYYAGSEMGGTSYQNIGIGYYALRGDQSANNSYPTAYNIGIGYNTGTQLSQGVSPYFASIQNIFIGYGAGGKGSISPYIPQYLQHCILIGNNPYYDVTQRQVGQLLISDASYYPATNFLRGDMPNANLYLKGSFNIDSTGQTLRYHSLSGLPNRTAGIDSLLNGVDTVRTTAYDANSLIFITDLSASGTPGHQYIDKINSVPGSYFIVLSKSALDNSPFNWFILKTY